MSRYLFRGKRVDNGEWVAGIYLFDDFGNAAIGVNGKWDIVKGFCYECRNHLEEIYQVDPDTISQCTGIKDKNGKLIFEGDALNLNCQTIGNEFDGIVGRVIFTECGYFIDDGKRICPLWQECEDLELIGNIRDNPELII